MAWRGYLALPPYFGGKRELCPIIFRELAKVHPTANWPGLRLVDPFLGGGAVSLYAKARGFGVVCGDLAERSVVVGKALIENDSTMIGEADLLRLFVPSHGNRHQIEQTYVPDSFTPEAARFLDNAFAVADEVGDSIKRDLLRLLLVKYVFSLRPHAQFRAPNAFNRPFAEGRFDDIKDTYRHALAANAEHPLPALRRLAKSVNSGVARGAQRCSAVKADARETICGCRAPVVPSWARSGLASADSLQYDLGPVGGAFGRRSLFGSQHGGDLRGIGVVDRPGAGGQRPVGGPQPPSQPGTGLRPRGGGTSGAAGGTRHGVGGCGGFPGCAPGGNGEAAGRREAPTALSSHGAAAPPLAHRVCAPRGVRCESLNALVTQ